ncbi:TGACG-sequence-specific DNA-binding protein TGA-2.1 [Carex littledalei]|uniref:TGACG-sequence-specific DNA-binding protein TGA-2.1 n=1 Tax=Carex littledalei TaxID=544730 RepID=A0A833R1G4_9POAL|nr:TGACG-sequence-specific DNA-binding protein TGA-2.1 [Carex littledalei]
MEAYFTEWVRQEESLVSSFLLAISSNDTADQLHLISLALAHIESYYLHKSRFAQGDVVEAFYPRYLTPFERTFLWLGGFRPSLLFKFVPHGRSDAMIHLKRSVSVEEKEMSKEMASLQEGLAARELLDAIRSADMCMMMNRDLERVVAEVGATLRALLASADRLRLCTLRGIRDALMSMSAPTDAAMFFAKAMNFHLQLHRFGLQYHNRDN